MNYAHGPRLWRNFTWPVRYAEVPLKSTFLNGELVVSTKEYNGQWALARFIYDCKISQNADGADYMLDCKQDGYSVQLLLNYDGKVNPFDKTLLTKVKLPSKI